MNDDEFTHASDWLNAASIIVGFIAGLLCIVIASVFVYAVAALWVMP